MKGLLRGLGGLSPRQKVVVVPALLMVGLVALQLLWGSVDLPAAALRVGLVLVLAVVAEQVVVPVAQAVVGSPAPRQDASGVSLVEVRPAGGRDEAAADRAGR